MAATVNRPPAAYFRPVGGNPGSHSSGLTSSVQPDLGPHSIGQDLGFSSHLHQPVFVPPTLYTHAPPPPPFLHYQWPMPFSFTPFSGYPNRSYGMVVPPPPYLEAPAYILPHPHIQPVDYRRLLHPQVPAQNPNQTRRTRLPYVPQREIVNSEVQTEPTQMNIGEYRVGWPPAVSDSGRGTGSNSSHSPGSSSPKQDPVYENGNCVNLCFTRMYNGSGTGDRTENEDMAHANDGEVLYKVLRLPHAVTEPCLESWETVEPMELPVCEGLSLNSKDKLQCSLSSSCVFLDGELENSNETNTQYDLTDIAPYKMSSSNFQMKQKLNESIWSVESLDPFIPSREWLLENDLFEPEVNKFLEEAGKDGLSAQSVDQIMKERRQSWRLFSMSVQMSENGLDINVQDEEQSSLNEMEVGNPEQGRSSVHLEHDSLWFPKSPLSEAVSPPTEEENNKRSSEPEATQSPNQEALIRNELHENSHSSEEETLLSSLAEKISSPGQVTSHTEVGDGAPVTLQKITKMSKRHLIDFGVQCSEVQEQKCFCGQLGYTPNKKHCLNIQMSGAIKLKLSGSMKMCRKKLFSGGRNLEGHIGQ
ncbi:uncharacterized protein LOC108250181 [Kryptolebias marmoratus]|uniref:uncharacterized protein LOC108250181 n=1 Tax=Kryptolebias marmoratus TaxID=37003 RepID=UPI000D5311CF|nr:uncharacterized protein LOC108250181 [Kryptolebias marmoratus]XP_024858239.1 uncharacterized protein LOC108250181 [Kryptolebias marmoratus]